MSTSGGYHEYIGVFNINQKLFPLMNHDVPPPPPPCTEHTLYRVIARTWRVDNSANSKDQDLKFGTLA